MTIRVIVLRQSSNKRAPRARLGGPLNQVFGEANNPDKSMTQTKCSASARRHDRDGLTPSASPEVVRELGDIIRRSGPIPDVHP
jgi:hypothetical protein